MDNRRIPTERPRKGAPRRAETTPVYRAGQRGGARPEPPRAGQRTPPPEYRAGQRRSLRAEPPKRAGKRRTRGRRRGMIALGAVAALLVMLITGVIVYNMIPKEKPVHIIVERTEKIRSYAEQFGLDPAYVASVIMAESGYDENSHSSADAQGLMQVLPETGEWIAHKLGETYTEGCLYDPDTAIRYGCWFLSWLMERYDGNMVCASSAYHQGQGTVDRWLDDPNYSDDGKTLKVIPSERTNTYVGRILRYYEKYKEVYGEN